MTAAAEVAREVAREVREYIENHGWVQGKSMDRETGAVCLSGALDMTCMLSNTWSGEVPFEHAFRRLTGTTDIISWNDALGRTYEEVILLLKQIEADEDQ